MYATLRLFFCILPAFCWVLNSLEMLVGAWTLPISLLYGWICIVAVGVGLIWWMKSQKIPIFILLVCNTLLLFEDFRIRTPDPQGIAILSWNIEGKADTKSPRQECVLEYLTNWDKEHPEGVMAFQEVRQFQKRVFSQALSRKCIWAPYHREKQLWYSNGMMICVRDEWIVRRPHHRFFDQHSSYGFLQTELRNKRQEQTYNLLNVHLESLYSTARNMPQFPKQGNVNFYLKDKLKKAEFGTIFHWFNNNRKSHQEQLQTISYILGILKDPTIITGDFNSSPHQWHHRNFRSQLQDAHRSTGFGFGSTVLRFSFIRSRVDYLYASKHLFWSGPTRVHPDIQCSDHLPFTSYFSLIKKD